jgi:hypothetical protein
MLVPVDIAYAVASGVPGKPWKNPAVKFAAPRPTIS